MKVAKFQDLACWQLSDEFKRGVYALVESSPAKEDRRFCSQLLAAAASAPRNLAEGFGIWGHPEAARYARIAKASLVETQNHLRDGIDRQFWKSEDLEVLMVLSNRAIGATVGWIKYLSTSKTPKSYWG